LRRQRKKKSKAATTAASESPPKKGRAKDIKSISAAARRYLGVYTFQERVAGRASQEMLCKICNKCVGWTDVLNYSDFFEVVCNACRRRHGNAFNRKAHFFRQTQKGDEYVPGAGGFQGVWSKC